MKLFKKSAAVLLAVIMILTLCSCSKIGKAVDFVKDKAGDVSDSVIGDKDAKPAAKDEKKPEKKELTLDGKWCGELNMGSVFEQALAEGEMEGVDPTEYFDFSGFVIPFVLTLNADKTYGFDVDRELFTKVLEDQSDVFAEGFKKYFHDLMDSLIEEEDIDLEDFLSSMNVDSLDEFLETSLGMTIEDFAKSTLDESFAEIRDDEETFKASGTWEFKDNIVSLNDDGGSESEGTYDKDADTITYSMAGFDDETFSLNDPFVVFKRG